jgi:hypothetical protein
VMELICGACQGRLLAELPGSTVACPHCGTHLQTPAVEPAPPGQCAVSIESGDRAATGPDPLKDPDPSKDTVRMDAWVPPEPRHDGLVSAEPFTIVPADAGPTAAPADEARSASAAPQVPAASGQSAGSTGPSSGVPAPGAELMSATASAPVSATWEDPKAEFRAAATLELPIEDRDRIANGQTEVVLSAGEAGDDPHKTTVVGFTLDIGNPATSPPAAGHEVSAAEVAGDSSVVAGAPPPASIPAAESSDVPDTAVGVIGLYSAPSGGGEPAKKFPARTAVRAGISPTMFIIVVSYASAMTLACLYLAFQLLSNPRTLDLPDLTPQQPKDKKKVTSLIYLSPDQVIPPANVLKLGESRQFGSLKVTPLRVTRGLVAFDYYEPEAEQFREPEGPVLKLHLRFENVSREQEFIPLDSKLVFTKEINRKIYGSLMANNFVCNVADRKKPARLVYMFDLTPNGNWLVRGENLDREFEPGQSIETFIPTTPQPNESLSGDLVWRVHFRKGYNPRSLRGVTTLIEVLFQNSDIIDEDDPAPAEPLPIVPAKESSAVKDA